MTSCYIPIYLQFVILVIDSTDRERLSITKEELYKMLACEVRPRQLYSLCLDASRRTWLSCQIAHICVTRLKLA